jgi:parvulin-like peptidyl-prolyl isomerase
MGLALAAGALGLRAEPADGILAVVSDTPITEQQLERLTLGDEEALYNQYRSQPDLFKRKLITLHEDGRESLINREVILQEFKQNLKIPESILDEFVQDRIKERFGNDNVRLTKQLEAMGLTREQLKKRFREELILELMNEKFVREPIISPKKVEDYYTAHRDDYKLEDQIRMRMIVLKKNSGDSADQSEHVRKRAEEILLQLKGGASFAELARSYSEGSSARDGGDTGWEDTSVVNKVLLENLDKLKPGEYSGVIDAPDACYLVRLEDRHSAHYKALNDVRTEIEKTLSARERDRLRKDWVERLRTKTFIARF